MKYRFSFTASSAMIPEFINLAQHVYKGKKVDKISDSVLGREKGATNKRQFRELKRRIKTLTPYQIELLAEGAMDEQKQITHLALCKSYGIYRDFVTEVINEKVKVYDQQLSELDLNSFISKKKMVHPELDELAESTEKKVKQVIYRMLYQVGIIVSLTNPYILLPDLSLRVKEAVVNENPELLILFFQNN